MIFDVEIRQGEQLIMPLWHNSTDEKVGEVNDSVERENVYLSKDNTTGGNLLSVVHVMVQAVSLL